MSIELTPEQEAVVESAIRSGAYRDAAHVIDRALEALNLDDEWLRDQSVAIEEKVGRGLAQLERGEGVSGDVARANLARRKSAYLSQNLG